MKQIIWFRFLTIIDLPHHRNYLRVHSNWTWLPGPQDQLAGTIYWKCIQATAASRISGFRNLKEKGSDSWIRHNRVEIRRPGVCLICFHASSIVFLAGVKVEFTTDTATIDQLDESVNLAAGLVIDYWPFKVCLRVGCRRHASWKYNKELYLFLPWVLNLQLSASASDFRIWIGKPMEICYFKLGWTVQPALVRLIRS